MQFFFPVSDLCVLTARNSLNYNDAVLCFATEKAKFKKKSIFIKNICLWNPEAKEFPTIIPDMITASSEG